MKRTYIFTYKVGQLTRTKVRRFVNVAQAWQFAEELRQGGAFDVKYSVAA